MHRIDEEYQQDTKQSEARVDEEERLDREQAVPARRSQRRSDWLTSILPHRSYEPACIRSPLAQLTTISNITAHTAQEPPRAHPPISRSSSPRTNALVPRPASPRASTPTAPSSSPVQRLPSARRDQPTRGVPSLAPPHPSFPRPRRRPPTLPMEDSQLPSPAGTQLLVDVRGAEIVSSQSEECVLLPLLLTRPPRSEPRQPCRDLVQLLTTSPATAPRCTCRITRR